jgi:hypothetical protein
MTYDCRRPGAISLWVMDDSFQSKGLRTMTEQCNIVLAFHAVILRLKPNDQGQLGRFSAAR